jgi:hypothetical protein
MAKPPEPISELIAAAQAVVVAKVSVAQVTGELPKRAEKQRAGETGRGMNLPAQKVTLVIERVLKGLAPSEVVLEKPAGEYTLEVGESGPFFIAHGKILGRYGPNTHNLSRIEAALK